jgi:uncharacterized OB-fold protein
MSSPSDILPTLPFPGTAELAPLLPPLTEQSKPFFDALRDGRLALQRCAGCDRVRGLVAPVCPYCGNEAFAFEAMSGAGGVHSWIRYRRSYLPAFEALMPYVVLCVALDEGARIFGRLIEDEPGASPDPFVGMRVEVVLERWPDGGVTHAFKRRRENAS